MCWDSAYRGQVRGLAAQGGEGLTYDVGLNGVHGVCRVSRQRLLQGKVGEACDLQRSQEKGTNGDAFKSRRPFLGPLHDTEILPLLSALAKPTDI